MALPSGTEAFTRDLDRLLEQAHAGEPVDPGTVGAVLGGLKTALEELRAAEERLLDQHDRLATALEAERARYEELFQLAPDAYLVTDTDGKVLEANRRASAFFGKRHGFLLGKPLATFVEPTDRQEFHRQLAELGHLRGTARLDLRMHRRDGLPMDVAATVTPVSGADGRTVGLRWLARDVTERKQTEARLWELNAELEDRVRARGIEAGAQDALLGAVLDQLPLGVVIEGAPSGAPRRTNAYARAFLGEVERQAEGGGEALYTLRQTTGVPVDPYDMPLAAALRGESRPRSLFELQLPGLGRRVLSIGAVPVRNAANEVIAAVAVFEDVSRRERQQRAEREFVSNAAHELRTPLTAISSAVQVLQDGAKEIPEERDRFLAHVERESERLQRLARALLLLARTESMAERPRLEIVPLRPLLEEAAQAVRPAAGVELTVHCRNDLAVLASRELLEQALLNLLGNAGRYTDAGSIVVSARAAGPRALIEVKDTGRGIAADEVERVFERFYRSGPRDAQGVGLGLSIARQAIESSDGHVSLESVEGKGTTVTILLPMARLVQV